jgi:hypothetical protein
MDNSIFHLILYLWCHLVNTEFGTGYLNVVCFILGNCPASEFCTPTLRNTLLFHLHRQVGMNFRRRGITQKKAYNIQNGVKVLNQEYLNDVGVVTDWKQQLQRIRSRYKTCLVFMFHTVRQFMR